MSHAEASLDEQCARLEGCGVTALIANGADLAEDATTDSDDGGHEATHTHTHKHTHTLDRAALRLV